MNKKMGPAKGPFLYQHTGLRHAALFEYIPRVMRQRMFIPQTKRRKLNALRLQARDIARHAFDTGPVHATGSYHQKILQQLRGIRVCL